MLSGMHKKCTLKSCLSCIAVRFGSCKFYSEILFHNAHNCCVICNIMYCFFICNIITLIFTGLGCSTQYFSSHFMSSLEDFAKTSPQYLKTVILVPFEQNVFTDICQEVNSKGSQLKSTLSKVTSFSTGQTRSTGMTLIKREKVYVYLHFENWLEN